jgi:TRAP transporter TAXI family solute receptor
MNTPLSKIIIAATAVFTACALVYLFIVFVPHGNEQEVGRLPQPDISPSQSSDKSAYLLATATTGGTFYPVGVALATLTKVKLEQKHKVSISAISSAGSAENVKLLRENQAQFALLQGLYGAWAWHGEGRIKSPQRHLRSITMLWQNVEHFAVTTDQVKTGTMADLNAFNQAKFSIGKRNSGTEGSGRHILSALDIDADNTFNLVHLGYGPSADALQNGNIKGMNIPAGAPVSAIARAFAVLGEKMTVLDFTDEQLEKVNRTYPLWTRYVIPVNTYPNQNQAIKTIAQPNFLAVRENVGEEAVYLITKTIYENLPFLHGIHKATKAMALEKAIEGLPLPLHPGAVRYYREKGIKIPDNLLK